MNIHEINSAEINARTGHNALVNLGAASASISFTVFQRVVTLLSGVAGISFDVLGDIAKYRQLGSTQASISFTTVGTLSGFAKAALPSGQAAVVFTASGSLAIGKLIPNASTGVAFGVDASLSKIQVLSAHQSLSFSVSASTPRAIREIGSSSSNFTFNVAGSLTQYIKRQIPSGEAVLEFEVKGALTQYVRQYLPASAVQFLFGVSGTMHPKIRLGAASAGICFSATGSLSSRRVDIPRASATFMTDVNGSLSVCKRVAIPNASASMSFSVAGSLQRKTLIPSVSASITFNTTSNISSVQRLSGASGIRFDVYGTLSNNPFVMDVPEKTMVRPYVNRVMVRQ